MHMRLALRFGVLLIAATVATTTAGPALASAGGRQAAAPTQVSLHPAAPALAADAHTALAAGLASTIALSNCSAALVRYPSSVDSDRALMLTNGHCYEGGMPAAGQVIQNRASTRSGTLLDAAGNALGTVRADMMLYATMTGTDVTLYRLTDTFAAIRTRFNATALTIADTHPADRTNMTIPSGFFKRIWTCQINGFVGTLREDKWTFHDSVRYNPECNPIHGTSGSPIVDATSGKIIGINNTGNDDGAVCTLNNPCEVDPNGNTTVHKGQSYGQQTYWFTTCLNSSRTIDLTLTGCLLTKPAGASCSGQKLANPGFESGATSWTATAGVIAQRGTTQPARTGTWNALLDGRGTTRTDTLSQSVAIPAGCHATLTFWLHIDTKETSRTTAFDKLTVQIGSSTLVTLSNLNAAAGYAQRSFDVSTLAGQTATVKFTGTEDASLQTSFVVDDTALTLS
jgi:hypothetical protein